MSEDETQVEVQWDTCSVTFYLEEEGAEYGQFQAYAESPHGDYLAGESMRFQIDEAYMFSAEKSLSFTSRNRNKLTIFLNSLQNDSWELLPDDEDAPWYEKRLRRPTREPENTSVTRKQWVWIVGIIICIALPLAYAAYVWTQPFPLGVTKYMELEPLEREDEVYPDPYYTGKVLVVNPLPVRVTDPLSGRPDPIHWQLPDEMRADTTEEIETVVWVACRTFWRSKLISRDCIVTVIDLEKLEVVGREEILSEQYEGPIPARERIGLRDADAIFDYISALPKR